MWINNKYGILLVVLALCGCSSKQVKFEPQDSFPSPTVSSETTCPESDLLHCALVSPLQDLADNLTSGSVQDKQSATIVDIGDEALTLRIHLIRAARSSIEVQTYIWANDETGALILKELMDAARRGVKVRIIADQLYSAHDVENAARIAAFHENLQVKLYNPLQQKAVLSTGDKVKGVFFQFNTLNHRMHNKIMIFDEKIGITGGRNIENKYYDRDPGFNFLDRDVLIVGKVAGDMVRSFNQYWDDPITVDLHQLSDVNAILFTEGRQNNLPPSNFPELAIFDGTLSRAVDPDYITKHFIDTAYPVNNISFSADRPQKPFVKNDEADRSTITELYNVVTSARESLVVQTPYFVLSNPAYKVLRDMRKENPDLRYIISTNSLASTDHYLVYSYTYKRKKRNFKTLGFQIYELKPEPGDKQGFVPRYPLLLENYVPPAETEFTPEQTEELKDFEPVPVLTDGPRLSIHAKSLVVDGQVAIIGSHNFDPRSLDINTEVTMTIRDAAFARALQDSIARFTAPQNSWIIGKRQSVPIIGHISGFFGSISRMLPIFDIWPFRYTTSFELREGMGPLAPTHPDFYSHYRDVGQFPDTNLGDDQLKTLLVSGFGGIAEPQM